jgi:Zn-dependent metalloprotease
MWPAGGEFADKEARLQLFKTAIACVLVSTLGSCAIGGDPEPSDGEDSAANDALRVVVRSSTADGLPKFVSGELGIIPSWAELDDGERSRLALVAIGPILAQRGLRAEDLRWFRTTRTSGDVRHLRYQHYIDDQEVVGGRLVVHVSPSGRVTAVNGRARGDVFRDLAPSTLDPETARFIATADPTLHDPRTGDVRLVYILGSDESGHSAFEVEVRGDRDGSLAKDLVYIDRSSGEVVATRSQLRDAFLYRRIYNAAGTNAVPPVAARVELDGPTGNAQVDLAYDNIGKTWNAFAAKLDRHWFQDPMETGDEAVNVVAHYGHIKATASCNGRWDRDENRILLESTGVAGCDTAGAVDFISHEYMHGITEAETSLEGADGESGGVNESMSDIFGAFVEAWVDGGMVQELRRSRETWIFGEKSGKVRRDMCDPAKATLDDADYWVPTIETDFPDNDHGIAGIQNLMLCLLSNGGSHPRGKSPLQVPALGMDLAVDLFYETLMSGYLDDDQTKMIDVREGMHDVAVLRGPAIAKAVDCAWAAVGVGSAAACDKTDIVWRNSDGHIKVWLMNGGTISGYSETTVPGPQSAWKTFGTGDFNGDGKGDVLWRNVNTREVKLWLWQTAPLAPEEVTATYGGLPLIPGTEWALQMAGDFDGGGFSDVLWREDGGTIKYWRMSGSVILDTPEIGSEMVSAWKIKSVRDFDRDGRSDVLWQNEVTDKVRIWFATARNSSGNAPAVSRPLEDTIGIDQWIVQGAGDFDGDGIGDILWRHANGDVQLWLLNPDRATVTKGRLSALLPNGSTVSTVGWQVQGTGDFNGDGKADIVWRNLSSNVVQIWFMNGNVITSRVEPLTPPPGSEWQIRGTGSFD